MPKEVFTVVNPEQLIALAQAVEREALVLRGRAEAMQEDGIKELQAKHFDQMRRAITYISSFSGAVGKAHTQYQEERGAYGSPADEAKPKKKRTTKK